MALERKQDANFNSSYSTIKASIMRTLHNKKGSYKYINTHEESEELIITTIKPLFWPLILKTTLEIKIKKNNNIINICAKTVAQPQITGDIFKMYTRYLNDFFTALNKNS